MKIRLLLAWPSKTQVKKAFKQSAYHDLAVEYISRISQFTECQINVIKNLKEYQKEPGEDVWLCMIDSSQRVLSSEELSGKMINLTNQGKRLLSIIIGGPDGLKEAQQQRLKPDFIWSFGPMTYPHELACVIACEQLYRAWAIMRGLPYHGGH